MSVYFYAPSVYGVRRIIIHPSQQRSHFCSRIITFEDTEGRIVEMNAFTRSGDNDPIEVVVRESEQ